MDCWRAVSDYGFEALHLAKDPMLVTLAEVSICLPFHLPGLGKCGVHFSG